MVRKRDRVIGTLLIWAAIGVSMAIVLGRLNYPRVNMQNNWYHFSSVITGMSHEEATRIMADVQSFGSELYRQTGQFVQAEMLIYLPYILIMSAVLLTGGILGTMFIWRSVVVPAEISERITSEEARTRTQAANDTLASLLDDDGELVNFDPQPAQNYKQEQNS